MSDRATYRITETLFALAAVSKVRFILKDLSLQGYLDVRFCDGV